MTDQDLLTLQLGELIEDAALKHTGRSLGTLASYRVAEAVVHRVRQIQAEAWREGEIAGQVNEHEFRPHRKMSNPYQEAA